MSKDTGVLSECGVVYVATKQDKYISEAFLSADSVKERYPALPVTLFTDRLDHWLCGSDRFDTVLPATEVGSFESILSEAKLKRSRCLRRSPYRRTLHLDTDTRIVTHELMSLFEMLDEIDVGMVETSADDSYSRLQYGRPMFNTGVIVYRRNDLTWDWLDEWATLSARNFRWATQHPLPRLTSLRHVANEEMRRELLAFDQVAMIEILSPEVNKFDLKMKILDPSWNYRGSRFPEKNVEAPRILHLPREDVPTYAADLETAIQKMLARMPHLRANSA